MHARALPAAPAMRIWQDPDLAKLPESTSTYCDKGLVAVALGTTQGAEPLACNCIAAAKQSALDGNPVADGELVDDTVTEPCTEPHEVCGPVRLSVSR